MTTVVLVGARDAALAAAERLGLRVFLLTERRPGKARARALAGLWVLPFSTPEEEVWRELAERFPEIGGGKRRPSAVIALTESSVELAAALRGRYKLEGTDERTAHACRDKFTMKRRVRQAGIACADFARVSARTTAASLVARLGLPLVLKPPNASGGRRTKLAKTFAEVERSLHRGQLAESFVHGMEMSVESFVSGGRVRFSNVTEYLLPLWANVVPAALPASSLSEILALNERVISSLGVHTGMTHLELFLTPSGPVFGEIALRPPGGQLMDLIGRSYGFDPWEALLRLELGEHMELPKRAKQTSGVWFLHPGPGRVRRVSGLAAAARVHGIDNVACRIDQGAVIAPRAGSGESVGHVLAVGRSRAEVVRALELARRSIVIETQPIAKERPRRSRSAA